MSSYELWDIDATNLVGALDNQRDALAVVLSGIELNGPGDTDTLVLSVEDEQGNIHVVAQGRRLADLAQHTLETHRVPG